MIRPSSSATARSSNIHKFSSSRNFSTSQVHRAIHDLGVVGAGQMGTGIAIVGAHNAKANVTMADVSKERLDESKQFINKWLDKQINKGKINAEDKDAVNSRLKFTTDIKSFEGTEFVVEAASENTDLKLNLFRDLDQITPRHAVLASNTSSISITKIAGATQRPEQVVGMHFMNPVPVMKGVEVITGLLTSEDTYHRTRELAEDGMGKITTRSKDTPGFIANRILMPYINEAVQALHEGVGNVEDIDTTMKLGTNVPMGPLRLADFIGLDTCLAIMRVLHTQFGDSKYRPSPLLVQMVDGRLLGNKTKRGFYDYRESS
eukprot:gb/GECH01012585.1/.p1 GENE.gb/GECH01012585.1/~~gb/GECH01012585.1/.p1  ORF type:complete len:319 (+),score=79.52 gb/GECH01012585.1/:1-957(+)